MLVQSPQTVKFQSNPNFGALKIATAKNCVRGLNTKIDIYKLTEKDGKFVDFLDNNIKYRELTSGLSTDMQDRWQKIFHYCIEEIKDGFNQNYIAVSDNKVCGVSTYYCNGTSSYLDGICKIPAPGGDEIPLIGKSLILNFFKSAQKANSKTIKLDAVKDGPFDVISLYEKLGFKKVFQAEDTGNYQAMEMNKYKLKEQIANLEKCINYKDVQNSEDVSLMDFVV